jgi:hypothetical protein
MEHIKKNKVCFFKMIYVIRHQEGEPFSNCLSRRGLARTRAIAKDFKRLLKNPLKYIHTCAPLGFAHARPFQTASVMCTELHDTFSVYAHVDTDDLVRDLFTDYDTVIVWHHGEIPDLVRQIGERYQIPFQPFEWDETDYDGIVCIDPFRKRIYIDTLFKKKFFFLNILNCWD